MLKYVKMTPHIKMQSYALVTSSPSYRSRGLGLLSMVSRIGGISVPMLLLLDEIWVGLSLLVIGILSSIGGVLCCFLPETMNKPLPATVQDVENLYRYVGLIVIQL